MQLYESKMGTQNYYMEVINIQNYFIKLPKNCIIFNFKKTPEVCLKMKKKIPLKFSINKDFLLKFQTKKQ